MSSIHNQEVPPTKITFVIDGKVVENMQVDNRLAAILLSEPKVIETTGIGLMPGDLYNEETNKFTRPEQIVPEQVIPAFEIN